MAVLEIVAALTRAPEAPHCLLRGLEFRRRTDRIRGTMENLATLTYDGCATTEKRSRFLPSPSNWLGSCHKRVAIRRAWRVQSGGPSRRATRAFSPDGRGVGPEPAGVDDVGERQ
jgi:hypothetical protein